MTRHLRLNDVVAGRIECIRLDCRGMTPTHHGRDMYLLARFGDRRGIENVPLLRKYAIDGGMRRYRICENQKEIKSCEQTALHGESIIHFFLRVKGFFIFFVF